MGLALLTFVALNRFAVWCDACATEIEHSAFDDTHELKLALRRHCADIHRKDVGFFKRIEVTYDPSDLRMSFQCGERWRTVDADSS